jgi:hypothetical protein
LEEENKNYLVQIDDLKMTISMLKKCNISEDQMNTNINKKRRVSTDNKMSQQPDDDNQLIQPSQRKMQTQFDRVANLLLDKKHLKKNNPIIKNPIISKLTTEDETLFTIDEDDEENEETPVITIKATQVK